MTEPIKPAPDSQIERKVQRTANEWVSGKLKFLCKGDIFRYLGHYYYVKDVERTIIFDAIEEADVLRIDESVARGRKALHHK